MMRLGETDCVMVPSLVSLIMLSPLGAMPSDLIVSMPRMSQLVVTQPIIAAGLPSRPSTGSELMANPIHSGPCELTLDNMTTRDVVINVRRTSNKKSIRLVYIRRGESYTLTSIPQGSYNVLLQQGEGWNPTTMSFTKNQSFSKYDAVTKFSVTYSPQTEPHLPANPLTYSIIQLTVVDVQNGKKGTLPTSKNDFYNGTQG